MVSLLFQLMCVCKVEEGKSPLSPFEDNSQFKTYSEYYNNKYQLKVTTNEQPLLTCKRLGKQLNYLSLKARDPLHISKEERKMERTDDQVLTMIPEFSPIYPINASLLAQAKFLPSILHRTSRFLIALEVRKSISKFSKWDRAEMVSSKLDALARRNDTFFMFLNC